MFDKLKEKLFFKLLENRKKATLLHLLKDKVLIHNYIVNNGQNDRIIDNVSIKDNIILNLQIENCIIDGEIEILDNTVEFMNIRYNTFVDKMKIK